MSRTERVIALRADGSTRIGSGHVMRCVAVAEELLARDQRPVLIGSFEGVGWLRHAVAGLDLPVVPAPTTARDLTRVLRSLAVDATVVDAHHLGPEHYIAARRTGPVIALCDGVTPLASVDAIIDPARSSTVRSDSLTVTGPSYAPIRRAVLEYRPRGTPLRSGLDRGHVLVVAGGTDPTDAAPFLAQTLLSARLVRTLTVVSPRKLVTKDPRLEVRQPGPDLPALIRSADVTVSAAGNVIWELCALAAPSVVVVTVENQVQPHDRAVCAGVAHGLGSMSEIRRRPALLIDVTEAMLEDGARRTTMAARGWRLVDGRGVSRIVDLVDELVGRPSATRHRSDIDV